jgi:hypothetical protein
MNLCHSNEWSEQECKTARSLLAQASGCLEVFAKLYPIDTTQNLINQIDAALGLAQEKEQPQ